MRLFVKQRNLPLAWQGDGTNAKPISHCLCVKNYFRPPERANKHLLCVRYCLQTSWESLRGARPEIILKEFLYYSPIHCVFWKIRNRGTPHHPKTWNKITCICQSLLQSDFPSLTMFCGYFLSLLNILLHGDSETFGLRTHLHFLIRAPKSFFFF